MKKIFLSFIFLFFLPGFNTFGIAEKIKDNTLRSMVIVCAKHHISAYMQEVGIKQGTGVVLDKKKGIILTTSITTGRASVSKYDVIFFDGSQVKAQMLYYDPWIRCSFLKVDPQKIPLGVKKVIFKKEKPKIDEKIFLLDSYNGLNFSSHKGRVTNNNFIYGALPQHCVNLSMDVQVSNGVSPIFDEKGNAIGLKYASGSTYAIGIHPEYITYIYNYLKKDEIPIRRHIGVITELYSLSKAVKVRKFPKNKLKEHIDQFGQSMTNAIQVFSVLKGSPAEGKLLHGDIIWSINGKRLGPNLIDLDMEMNKTKNDSIDLVILRNGNELKINIPLYDLEKNKIKSLLSIGNFVYFKADDLYTNVFGMPIKSLVLKKHSTNFIDQLDRWFLDQEIVQVISFDSKYINDLEHLKLLIPSIRKRSYYLIEGIVYLSSNIQPLRSRLLKKIDMFFDTNEDAKIYHWNQSRLDWDLQIIK